MVDGPRSRHLPSTNLVGTAHFALCAKTGLTTLLMFSRIARIGWHFLLTLSFRL